MNPGGGSTIGNRPNMAPISLSHGSSSGVTVTGRPVIDADTEIVSLQELDYELETEDTLATAQSS